MYSPPFSVSIVAKISHTQAQVTVSLVILTVSVTKTRFASSYFPFFNWYHSTSAPYTYFIHLPQALHDLNDCQCRLIIHFSLFLFMTLDGCEWCVLHHVHLTVKKRHPVVTDSVDPIAILVNLKNTEMGLLQQLRMKLEFIGSPVCNTVPEANEPSL